MSSDNLLAKHLRAEDVCAAMEEWAPAGLAYSWDRVGLQVGRRDAPVERILAALSVDRHAFERAREEGVQMIVAHHPLVWSPLRTLRTDDPHTALCLDIAAAGMCVYIAHTNLDVCTGGLNDALAEKLGLSNIRPLVQAESAGQVKLVAFTPESHLDAVRDAVCRAGAGLIGEYSHCSFSSGGIGTFLPGDAASPFSGEKNQVNEEAERRIEVILPKARLKPVLSALFEAHPYEEVAYDVYPLLNDNPDLGMGRRGALPEPVSLNHLAGTVCERLALDHVRIVGDSGRQVRTAGVVTGSGGSFVPDAAGQVDVLITGDVKYHEAQAALEQGLCVIDAGHRGTEQLAADLIADYLRGRLDADVAAWQEHEPFTLIRGKR